MQIQKSSENLIIFILSGLFFFHILEFMIIMPLGPQLMQVLGINATQFSHLVAVYNFAAATSGVLGLFWMDRWDRKKVLIVVNVLFAFGTAICFMTTSYPALLTARFLTGAFGGVIGALCMTVIGDLVPMERRGFAMSKLMSAFSLASIAGIPLGLSLAAHFSWQTPFIVITSGSLLFCTIAYFKMPPLRSHLHEGMKTSFKDLLEIVLDHKHHLCFVFMVLLMFSQFMVIPFISSALVGNAGMTQGQLPLVYLVGGLATAITNPSIGKLSDYYKKEFIFKICAVMAWIPLLILTHQGASSLFFCIFVTTLFFIFNSGRMSPAMAIITSVVEAHKRGRFMSLNSAVQQASAGLAAWLGGMIVTSDTSGKLHGLYFTGYISVLAGFLSVYWVRRLSFTSTVQRTDSIQESE